MTAIPRITIDVTSAFHQTAGIGRLTRETVAALNRIPNARHQYRYFCMGRPAAVQSRLSLREFARQYPTVISRFSDRNLYRLWFKAHSGVPVTWLSGGASDLYHATDFVLPPLPRGHASVLTVHDLTFERDPGSATPTLLAFLRNVVPRAARAATRLVADSHATARDLETLYGIDPQKITTIYCGVSPQFASVESSVAQGESIAIRAKYGLGHHPFVLAVGTMQKRKNHRALVRAFAGLADSRSNLVIAGGKGWLYEDVMKEVHANGLEDRVKFAGFVAEPDLPALYRAARVFAFPSLYEGFGLPLLEAMACGIPVIGSNVSSLPEVLGDVGLQVSPTDLPALTAALNHAWKDESWRKTQVHMGQVRAAQFSWDASAGQLADVYDRVLAASAKT